MRKKQIKTIISYSCAKSLALIIAAEENKEFKKYLSKLIRDKNIKPKNYQISYNVDNKIKLLKPESVDIAFNQAEWLIKNIIPADTKEKKEALEVLASWISDQPLESPKQVVVGALAIAIPGITLGLFPSKKKMSVLISKNITNNKKVAQLSVQSSSGLIAKQLKQNPDISKLEPDTADWFLNERHIKLYSSDYEKFNQIIDDLKELSVAHEIIKENDEIVALAISPAINNYFSENYWDLTKL